MTSPTDQTTPPMLALEAVSCLTSGNCRRAALLAWQASSLSQPDRDQVAMIEARIQADYLRDIFGNPFRPLTLSPSHRTPTVVSLTRAAYDERHMPTGELDPHRLAVLADALEEAGATGELLAHLRGLGPHVRGCFVVDLCLGLS